MLGISMLRGLLWHVYAWTSTAILTSGSLRLLWRNVARSLCKQRLCCAARLAYPSLTWMPGRRQGLRRLAKRLANWGIMMTETMATSLPLLYRVSETADLLGISRSRCYELIYEGAIPAIKLGGTWRVPRVQLEAWIEAQTEAAGACQGRPAALAGQREVAGDGRARQTSR